MDRMEGIVNMNAVQKNHLKIEAFNKKLCRKKCQDKSLISIPFGSRQSQLVWRTVTQVIYVMLAIIEWPTQNPPPTFAACGVWIFKVHYISLKNVLQVIKYLYTIWILLCDQKGPNALPKCPSEIGMNRTL